MGKHLPTVIWPTRPMGVRPQQYVRTADESNVEVTFVIAAGEAWAVRLSRHDARMLARRLNQCLDETTNRAARIGGPT